MYFDVDIKAYKKEKKKKRKKRKKKKKKYKCLTEVNQATAPQSIKIVVNDFDQTEVDKAEIYK